MWGESALVELRGGDVQWASSRQLDMTLKVSRRARLERQHSVCPPSQSCSATQSSVGQQTGRAGARREEGRGCGAQVQEGATDAAARRLQVVIKYYSGPQPTVVPPLKYILGGGRTLKFKKVK